MRSLYSLKPWFSQALRPVLGIALRLKLSPDIFTTLNVLAGFGAGYGIYMLNAWLVLAAVILRLAFANLDGSLARARSELVGTPISRFGFMKNEIGDRLSDFATMSGFIFLPEIQESSLYSSSALMAVFVAGAPTIISLVGVRNGLARINGGPFGKTERAFGCVLIVFIANLSAQVGVTVYFGSLAIILGSLVTAWVRYFQIVKR